MKEYELIVIGGGVAGMSASIAAKQNGVNDILLIEREERLGGIVNQCIHNGFGKKVLGTKVTGPEYIEYLKKDIIALNIKYNLNTMVLRISHDNIITFVNPDEGMQQAKAKAIIVATGSREMYTGRINIINSKITGVYTIGTAQQFVNIHGYLPGKEIVIVGSNEISILVARRLIIEGAKIKAIVEDEKDITCKSSKIKNLIDIFSIPVLTSSAVTELIGNDRIEKVKVSSLDEENEYTEYIDCDCVLLAVDWIAETNLLRELKIDLSEGQTAIVNNNMMTERKGIFCCGNVIHCYGYADDTTMEGIKTGKSAANYIYELNLRK